MLDLLVRSTTLLIQDELVCKVSKVYFTSLKINRLVCDS